MIVRDHLARVEASIDPVFFPNLNGWDRSEVLDWQLSTNQSGAPNWCATDAFSCIATRPFIISAFILKASDCFPSHKYRHNSSRSFPSVHPFFIHCNEKKCIKTWKDSYSWGFLPALIGPSRHPAPNKETSLRLPDNFIIIRHDFYITRVQGRWLNR